MSGCIGMRVSENAATSHHHHCETKIFRSIVEYATRDQAQTAINTLSNQNLMGRLIYVREVR